MNSPNIQHTTRDSIKMSLAFICATHDLSKVQVNAKVEKGKEND